MGGNIGLNANEMSSGAGSSSGEGSTRGESSGGRNAIHRVAQYTLNDVKFVEELGEGAFGKIYYLTSHCIPLTRCVYLNRQSVQR